MFKRVLATQGLGAAHDDSDSEDMTVRQKTRMYNKFIPGAARGQSCQEDDDIGAARGQSCQEDDNNVLSKGEGQHSLDVEDEPVHVMNKRGNYRGDEQSSSFCSEEEETDSVDEGDDVEEPTGAAALKMKIKLPSEEGEAAPDDGGRKVVPKTSTARCTTRPSIDSDDDSDFDDTPAWPAACEVERSAKPLTSKFRCELCPDKILKSQAELDGHLRSKKHRKVVEELERAAKMGFAKYEQELLKKQAAEQNSNHLQGGRGSATRKNATGDEDKSLWSEAKKKREAKKEKYLAKKREQKRKGRAAAAVLKGGVKKDDGREKQENVGKKKGNKKGPPAEKKKEDQVDTTATSAALIRGEKGSTKVDKKQHPKGKAGSGSKSNGDDTNILATSTASAVVVEAEQKEKKTSLSVAGRKKKPAAKVKAVEDGSAKIENGAKTVKSRGTNVVEKKVVKKVVGKKKKQK
ncbi:unnamed protein product [Amoebophrya sp. A120]|nr:unnamed protein product [Amoebophrya sp. A120]|eukprot:GSA120T00016808001.1